MCRCGGCDSDVATRDMRADECDCSFVEIDIGETLTGEVLQRVFGNDGDCAIGTGSHADGGQCTGQVDVRSINRDAACVGQTVGVDRPTIQIERVIFK